MGWLLDLGFLPPPPTCSRQTKFCSSQNTPASSHLACDLPSPQTRLRHTSLPPQTRTHISLLNPRLLGPLFRPSQVPLLSWGLSLSVSAPCPHQGPFPLSFPRSAPGLGGSGDAESG